MSYHFPFVILLRVCASIPLLFFFPLVNVTGRVTHVSPESREYLPELARARAAREKSLQDVKETSLSRFMSDLSVDRAKNPSAALNDQWESEEENDDEDLDVDIIDRSKWYLTLSFALCPQTDSVIGEERLPGQYIDVTRMRRQDEQVNWPRPA